MFDVDCSMFDVQLQPEPAWGAMIKSPDKFLTSDL